MADTPSAVHLRVDGAAIYGARVVELLDRSGRLAPVLGWVLRELVIERELAGRAEIEVDSRLLAAAAAAFRLESGLVDELALSDWLGGRGRSGPDFNAEVARCLRLELLKHEVTRADLEAHFERRRPFLDRVVLTMFSIARLDAADELARGLRSGLAEAATSDDAKRERATVLWVDVPEPARRGLEDAPVAGLVLGPVELDGGFGVFKVHEALPASLADEETRRRIRDELFELWLAERLEVLDVELVMS